MKNSGIIPKSRIFIKLLNIEFSFLYIAKGDSDAIILASLKLITWGKKWKVISWQEVLQ